MKKQILYLASAALLAGLAACSSDELEGASDIKLASNQLAAYLPDATTTRVGFSGNATDGYKLKWETNDAFGVFSSDNGDENQKFTLTSTDDSGLGTFTAEKAVTNAKYAYYPYDENITRIGIDGKLKVTLAGGEQTYTGASIKIPMFGKVDDNQKVTFTPLTALLKVTVLNMPANTTKAVLSSYGTNGTNGDPLYGAATISGATSNPVLELNPTGNDEYTDITYNFTSSDITEEMDFYYIIPAGNYNSLVFSLDDTYTAGTSKLEDLKTANKVFEAEMESVTAGTVWTKTIRFTEDGNIEEDAVTKINDELAGISSTTTSNSSNTSLAGIKSNPTIIIPTVGADETPISQEITVTLTDIPDFGTTGAYKAPKITIKQDKEEGLAPTSIKIVASKASGATNANVDFDIQLPNSKVTLSQADGTNAAKTYDNVYSNTKSLVVDQYTTITNLEIQGGYVLLNHSTSDGVVKKATLKDIENAFIFYQTGHSDVTTTDFAKDIDVQPESIYNLLMGEGTSTLADGGFELKQAVTVETNKSLTIDLNGQTLTIGEGGSITVNGGTLTIKDTAGTDGVVTSELADAVVTVNGGILNLGVSEGNNIAVKSTNTTPVAISATNGTVNLITADVTGAVKLAKSSDESASLSAVLTKGSIAGDITVEGGASLADVTSASVTITGNIAVENASSVSLQAATVTGKTTLNGATAFLELKGGSISVAEDSDDTAITIKGGATAKVAGTSKVNGGTYAIDVQKGTFEVTSEAGKAEIKGDNIIKAVPEAEYDAVIKLASETAEYTAANAEEETRYVINNSNGGSAPKAKMTITGGIFDGDVISDQATYFITAGSFKNCDNFYAKQTDYVKYTSVVTSVGGYLVVSVPKGE